ncbi:MAG: sigma-70 family RNA polymerase sigma factor [Lawsonibacter sp.]|uniref:sigma-70 family RNA polymerase sigma factor n=1 Tax=Flintibacter sp. TaxID=1918624 RepID=UPI002A8924F5|nr:sigma-70 family RNA polymerase sigma factor [Lawsonibacter sp.]
MEKTPTSICSTTMGTASTQNQQTTGMAAIQRVRQERIANEILMHFRAQKKLQGEVSLSDTMENGGDGNSLSLMDVIAVDDNMLEDLDTRDACRRVRQCVGECLNPRERAIITLRYGLDDQPPRTQREVAARCGISRSYVSRIEKRALAKLEQAMDGWRP